MVTFLRPLTGNKFNFDVLNGLFACAIAVKWYLLLHCFIPSDDRHFYGNCHHKHNSKSLSLDFLPPFPFHALLFVLRAAEKFYEEFFKHRRKFSSEKIFNMQMCVFVNVRAFIKNRRFTSGRSFQLKPDSWVEIIASDNFPFLMENYFQDKRFCSKHFCVNSRSYSSYQAINIASWHLRNTNESKIWK